MNIYPPKYAEKLLRIFLPNRDREFLLGDFDYLFHEVFEKRGSLFASLWYWFIVVKAIPSFVNHQIYWGGVMFTNYFKIAFRNIKKQKVNSFINISGLTIGIAAVVLLLLYIQYELNYDTYHAKVDRIYRVAVQDKEDGRLGIHIPATVAPMMIAEIPEVENAARIMKRDDRLFTYNEKKFLEKDIIFADPEIFKIFSFELVNGDKETALVKPNSIVLTESMANKYFGNANPIGKVIKFEDEFDFEITAVMKDLPGNSHFNVNFLIPFQTVKQIWSWIDLDSWRISMYNTYFTLKENAAPEEFQRDLTSSVANHTGDAITSKKEILIQPLTSIHLHSHSMGELGDNADVEKIYILSLITLLILIIASINYMNLSTAQSSRRIKEIGIRKVIGANKKQLVLQFIGESFIVTALSFLLALIVVWFSLPSFNQFVQRGLSLNLFNNYEFLGWLLILFCIVGFFAGLYPALVISSFGSSSLFKEKSQGLKKSKFRSSMIVAQFTISVILIIVTLTIKGQMNFVRTTPTGFAKENIVVVDVLDDKVSKNKEAIKSELMQNANVMAVAASSYLPNEAEGMTSLNWAGKPEDSQVEFYFNFVDYEFFDLFELELADGRKFSREFVSDSIGGVIINETAMKSIGWESAVGKEVLVPQFGGPAEPAKVVGVAKDFNMLSLHSPIAPFFFKLSTKYSDTYLSIKTTGVDPAGTLDYIKSVISKYSTSYPFSYNYFDDICNSYYESEQQLGNVFSLFSMFAIIIACMGLFGMTLFSTIQRTKEIGIRKVLGASVSNVIYKLSGEFAKYILIANAIAWPVAYYLANLWLTNFAYKISPQLWMFAAACLIILAVALITVGYQTLKAASANPVDSLRYE